MWARGAIRFYLPLNVQLPNDFFAQAVIVAKDVAARERLRAKLEKIAGRRFSERGRPRLSAGARAAGRLAGAVPRQRPRSRKVREIALELARIVAKNPQAVHINFDWIEPARAGAHPHRPGRGAPAGAQLRRHWRACSTP